MRRTRHTHYLKCWPDSFGPLALGHKTHEVRVFDRDYRVGDLLILQEYDPGRKRYSGREIKRYVTHMTPPGSFGLPAHIGVMSVKMLPESTDGTKLRELVEAGVRR